MANLLLTAGKVSIIWSKMSWGLFVELTTADSLAGSSQRGSSILIKDSVGICVMSRRIYRTYSREIWRT
ncbi:hypothetical protein AVEN_247206-1, partial [Araneus ventricosus]